MQFWSIVLAVQNALPKLSSNAEWYWCSSCQSYNSLPLKNSQEIEKWFLKLLIWKTCRFYHPKSSFLRRTYIFLLKIFLLAGKCSFRSAKWHLLFSVLKKTLWKKIWNFPHCLLMHLVFQMDTLVELNMFVFILKR